LVRALALILGALLALLLLAAVSGAAWQAVAERKDRAASPPPGELVDVGGYRLHVDVRGPKDSAGSPATVVLDAASLSVGAQWGWVQHHLDGEVRVVAYDRPGQGWSDPPDRSLDAAAMADDLDQALTAVGVDGPRVLVGHSMGSLTARAYLDRHADKVVGMVLADPRFLSMQPIYPGESVDPRDDVFLRLAGPLARLGVMRALNPLSEQVDHLPEAEAGQARVLLASTQQWAGAFEDVMVGESAAALLEEDEPALQDLPLIVLTAPEADANAFPVPLRQRFTDQQALLAARSDRAELRVVPGANHYTIVTDRDHARVVADAILELTSVADS
jgi:pimeloyl-ACP methyl ester carboxylesterase